MALKNLNSRLSRIDSSSRRDKKPRSKKKFIYILAFLVILALAIYLPVRGIYASIRQINTSAKAASEAFKNENLDDIKSNVKSMQDSVGLLNTSLDWLFWVRIIPYVGGFYADAKHFSSAATYELQAGETIIKLLEPKKDELGFTGHPTPGQDRVVQAVKVLSQIVPNLDQIEPQLKSASQEVSSIDASKYPESIGGRQLKSRITLAKDFIGGAYTAVSEARPALEEAPDALGVGKAKTYLIIFQNDKELRATGGFMTAYAFMKLDQGHISASQSDDIYRLDEKMLQVCQHVICPLTPPAAISKYLPEADGKPRTAWSMRDSNLSPDLATSMQTFEKMYSYLNTGQQFDGIITIDTHVVEELIKITGPIEVFGTTYSAAADSRCNCSNVIYGLEDYAQIIEKGSNDRKAILGTLMQQILAHALGASTQKMPDFLNIGFQLANEKHIMFYMHDPKLQAAMAQLNWTGEIKPFNGDYLHINDSNFAGGKSNLYVQQEVELDIDTNKKTNTLNIKYNNPQPYNTWLNGINRDYIRIYVPQGSKLINSKGSQVEVTTIPSELGKTVFEAFIQVRPQNSLNISFQYQLPQGYKAGDGYPLLIQKQPGKNDFKYTVKIDGKTQTFDLDSDKNLKI